MGDDQVQRILQQRPLVEALVGHGRRVRRDDEQGQIGLFREQQVEAAVRFRLDDAHPHVRVGIAQSGGGGRQQTAGGGGEAAQCDRAGGLGTDCGQFGAGEFPLLLQALRVAQQDAGGVRQADAAALLHHELRTHRGGELTQLVRDR